MNLGVHIKKTLSIHTVLIFTAMVLLLIPGCGSDGNREDDKKHPKNRTIVFMGNSITQSWPDFLPEFFRDKPYINKGISGETTREMLQRYQTDVLDLKPYALVILAGTNDIAGNGGDIPIDETADNVIHMAEVARENGIEVLLCSILPVRDYHWRPGRDPIDKIRFVNQRLQAYAREANMIYVDYYSAMLDDEHGLESAYTYDGVHPDREGYEVMARILSEAIKRLH